MTDSALTIGCLEYDTTRPLPAVGEGDLLADVIPCVASIDPITGGMDR